MRAIALLPALLVIAGCMRGYEPYAPSEARRPLDIQEPVVLQSWLRMNDPKASWQLLRDIKPHVEGGVWRWTTKKATVSLSAPRASGLRFAADIAVPEINLNRTGPVTITVFINGHQLTVEHYDTPGNKRIEKPVPDGWVDAKRENIVSLDIDKTWTSPEGHEFGFVLTALGFLT